MRLFRTSRLTDDQRIVLNVLVQPMWRVDIAEHTGLDHERVNTVLGQLSERRLVSAGGGHTPRWAITWAGQRVAGR